MGDLLGSVLLTALLVGLLGCVAPTASPSAPAGGPPSGSQPPLSQPSLPRPSGPSSTIEVPPPIK